MLYKRLFDAHATGSFDWQRCYDHIGLDRTASLSDNFQAQTKALYADAGIGDLASTSTLGDLEDHLRRLHGDLGPLQDTLELVYRWRSSSSPTASVRKRTRRKSPASAIIIDSSSEDEATQRAIEASLVRKSQKDQAAAAESSDDITYVGSSTRHSPEVTTVESPATSSQTSLPATPVRLQDLVKRADRTKEAAAGAIIGREKFVFEDSKLMQYLRDALDFWRGRVSGTSGSWRKFGSSIDQS